MSMIVLENNVDASAAKAGVGVVNMRPARTDVAARPHRAGALSCSSSAVEWLEEELPALTSSAKRATANFDSELSCVAQHADLFLRADGVKDNVLKVDRARDRDWASRPRFLIRRAFILYMNSLVYVDSDGCTSHT